ncbi:MAG: PAS domain S-box protein [Rhodospirillales bacterium]|nr:PAS domain S-box protein [Rhodospirillales bacterium]
MFKLLRYFSITSLATVLVTAVIMSYWYQQESTDNLIEDAEGANITLAGVFANEIWSLFGPRIVSVSGLDGTALLARPETEELRKVLETMTFGLPILKVKIYDLKGLTVFSSEKGEIGKIKRNNLGFFAAAREGKPSSELVHKGKFSAFSGEVFNRDLVETYVPIRPGGGAVEAVFEVYSDVTPLTSRVNQTQMRLVFGLLVAFALLYSVLFLVIRRADRLLKYQHKQIAEALRVSETGRRHVQISLEESEEQFRAAAETANDAIISADDKGAIIYWNKAAERIFGFTKREIVGHPVTRLIPKSLRFRHTSGYQRASAEGELRLRGVATEVTARRKDGSDVPVELSLSHWQVSGQKYFTAIIRDITERRQSENSLRRAQKMEAVGQLTGGIAHDFNNMLGVIMGNLDLLRHNVAEDPEAMKFVETAFRGTERGAALTKKLLSFSRADGANQELTDVNDSINGMENLIAKSLTAKISVETQLAEDLWTVNIDPRDFEDTLLNLSLNARDAIPHSGSLVIETTNKILDEHYVRLNPGSRAGEFVTVLVSDTGIGMTPEVLDQVFQPFFTTKKHGEGTGLGLSMVYGFIQRSSGHIKIYSEPDNGTTVRMYLPRATRKSNAIEATKSSADDDLPQGDETILIVEDEEDLREVAVSFLENLGYLTLTATTGKQALEVLQEGRQVDLLFSDIVLPGGMEGYDLAENVAKSHPGLKILLTTGFTARREMAVKGDLALFSKLSAELLSKPYSQLELASAVRRTLDGQP